MADKNLIHYVSIIFLEKRNFINIIDCRKKYLPQHDADGRSFIHIIIIRIKYRNNQFFLFKKTAEVTADRMTADNSGESLSITSAVNYSISNKRMSSIKNAITFEQKYYLYPSNDRSWQRYYYILSSNSRQ